MVREGAAALGGVGLAIGLAAPPLLATTAIGAALGAGAGKLLHHKTADKIGEQAGETIPLGGAGLIVVYSQLRGREGRARRDPRGADRSSGEAEGRHVQAREGRARGRPAEDGRRERMTSSEKGYDVTRAGRHIRARRRRFHVKSLLDVEFR